MSDASVTVGEEFKPHLRLCRSRVPLSDFLLSDKTLTDGQFDVDFCAILVFRGLNGRLVWRLKKRQATAISADGSLFAIKPIAVVSLLRLLLRLRSLPS